MLVTNAYAAGDTLVLVHRADDGSLDRIELPAERSLFLRVDSVNDALYRELKDAPVVSAIKRENDWFRVIATDHEGRRGLVKYLLHKGVQIFEGDVNPVRRYLADTGTQVDRPRRAFVDFEADSRSGFKFRNMRTISWSVVYEDGTSQVELLEEDTDAAEERLLRKFWAAIESVDQVCAWNGKRFDFPFLLSRSDKQAILIDHRRWLWMDMMLAYQRLGRSNIDGDEKESIGLEAVGQIVVGEGKTEVPDFIRAKYGKHRSLGSLSYDMWASGGQERALLRQYNLHDADLMRRIEGKIGVLAMHDAICQACQVLPDTYGLFPTQHVEGFMLRLGIQRGVHFRTMFKQEEEVEEEQFRGAHVLEPQKLGLVNNVHVADFSSMYPSIILTWNLSPETKDMNVAIDAPLPPGRCMAPETRIAFTTSEVGLLPMALSEMLKLRKEWADKKASLTPGTEEWIDAGRRSDGYKIAANSFYGVAGNKYSRYYDRDVAESVSTTGAWLIKQVMKEAEARRMLPLYGDTDSVMISDTNVEDFARFCDWLNQEALPRWALECGCPKSYLKIAYEKAFESIILFAKKRYCNTVEAPILLDDFTTKPLGKVNVGDRVMGWVEAQGGRYRHMVSSEVVAVHSHRAKVIKVRLQSGNIVRCTEDHLWYRSRELVTNRGLKHYEYPYCTPKVSRKLARVFDSVELELMALTSDQKREAAWLGGIFDGEGSLSGITHAQISICQSRVHNPEVCERIESSLRLLNFDYSVRTDNGDCERFAIKGGRQARLRFLRICQPAKSKRLIEGMMRRMTVNADRIVSIEDDGFAEVIGLTTSTGNYIAWGYASKNCGKFSHYKGKAASADSKPEVRGLEYRRGDTGRLARAFQKEVIYKLLGIGQTAISDPVHYELLARQWQDHVLDDKLDELEIALSKSLSKNLDMYQAKVKKDGTDSTLPAHVQIGRLLRERGEKIEEGTRIVYFIKDGEKQPIKYAPIADYDGTSDRYYLWEHYVWPPTERILEIVFPMRDWKRLFGRARPKRQRNALPGQEFLFPEKVLR